MEETDANHVSNALILSTNVRNEDEERKLKHLDFVHTSVENMVFILAGVYDLLKDNVGPLKPRVEIVEGTLKTVVGPLCDKFHHVPFHLLELIDRKVDESMHEVDWQRDPLPVLLRHVAEKAPELLYELGMEIHRTGLLEAAADTAKEAYLKFKPVAKELVYKYEPVAEEYAVWAWRLCNQIPIVSQVTQIMVPAAVFWAERYNQAVSLTADRGLPVAGYLPSIPVDRIAHVFAEDVDETPDENDSRGEDEPDADDSEEVTVEAAAAAAAY